jgi:hypothetical protein
MQPNPPIFVIEGLDIRVYQSLEDALGALEAIDVRNNEYSVYDGDGRRLELGVVQTPFWGHEKVVLSKLESESAHAAGLAGHLAAFLAYSGVDSEWLRSASLAQLERGNVGTR